MVLIANRVTERLCDRKGSRMQPFGLGDEQTGQERVVGTLNNLT